MADVVAGGVANVHIGPRIPLTVDLAMHRTSRRDVERLTMRARKIKAGRTVTINEVVFLDPAGDVCAISHVTFMPSPRPDDVMGVLRLERPARASTLAGPILDAIGVRLVSPGVAELDLHEYVMQPSGTIQGGAIAMVAEHAAETAAEAPVTDLEIRYLAAVWKGPARAVAAPVGERVLRVEVRDTGSDDKLAALVMAFTR